MFNIFSSEKEQVASTTRGRFEVLYWPSLLHGRR